MNQNYGFIIKIKNRILIQFSWITNNLIFYLIKRKKKKNPQQKNIKNNLIQLKLKLKLKIYQKMGKKKSKTKTYFN
jgi:hypothetical protein